MAAASASSLTAPRHIAYVDGLRAVAVLAVVASHAAKYTMDFHQGLPFHVLFEGSHGVDLFFVISGFCLAYPSLRKRFEAGRARFDVVEFFSRRIVRIMPPYWAAFAVILAIALVAIRFGGAAPWPTVKIPSMMMGIRELFFVDDGSSLLCGSFWTLALEFRWYLLFPIVLWLYFRSPYAVGLLCAACFGVYNFTTWHEADVAALPAFAMGILAADLAIRNAAIAKYGVPLFVLATAAAVWLEPKHHLTYALQNQLPWQLAAFFFVVAAGAPGVLRRVLESKPAIFIGVASYSIYLLHDPPMAWYGYAGGANVGLAMIVGVLSGIAFWYVLERHVVAGKGRDALLSPIRRVLERMAKPLGTSFELRAAPQSPQM